MATGTLMPAVFVQFSGTDGAPLAGGKLQAYLAGTTTPTPMYNDVTLTTPTANPIVLNAAGRPGAVYLDPGISYKFVLKDANDVTIETYDNITPAGLALPEYEQFFFFGGEESAAITNTTYAGLDTPTKGSTRFRIDSADLPPGTYFLAGMLQGSGGIATTDAALVNMTDADDTAIVQITVGSPNPSLQVSTAITFAAPGGEKEYAVKSKVSTGTGHAWGFYLIRTP